MFLFSSQIYLNAIFLYWPIFFILIRNLNTTLTFGETKPVTSEFFVGKIFVSFVKLLNINLDKYSLFLSHLKSVFFNGDNRKEHTSASFQEDHK